MTPLDTFLARADAWAGDPVRPGGWPVDLNRACYALGVGGCRRLRVLDGTADRVLAHSASSSSSLKSATLPGGAAIRGVRPCRRNSSAARRAKCSPGRAP